MRIAVAVLGIIFLLPAVGSAQVVPSKDNSNPSEKEVFDLLGQPLAQVFAKFGNPVDVSVSAAKSKNPKVRVDYGDFGFSVADKKVTECIAWNPLTGAPALGIKFGDATEDIEKKLGTPKTKITNAGGGGVIIWNDPKQDRQLEVIYSKANKCIGLTVMAK